MTATLEEDNNNYDNKSSFHYIEDVIGLHGRELERAVDEKRPRLHGRTLTYALAFVAGTGFTLFGYDMIH